MSETHEEGLRDDMESVIRSLKRRIFLLTGWGRWLHYSSKSTYQAMDELIKRRNMEYPRRGGLGILVEDDPIARQYQRLRFRLERAGAVFAQPCVSMTWSGPMYSPPVTKKISPFEGGLPKYRARAHAAVHDPAVKELLQEMEREAYELYKEDAAREVYR